MSVTLPRLHPHRAESIALCLVALLFAVATVYDVTRQVRIDDRLHADLVSWSSVTGVRDAAAFVKQDLVRRPPRDVVCGRVPPRRPDERFFACLIFQGPVRAGHRTATGGYYFMADYRANRWRVRDRPPERYGCFGAAVSDGFSCAGSPPAGGPDRPLIS